jgi:hypothetical protein
LIFVAVLCYSEKLPENMNEAIVKIIIELGAITGVAFYLLQIISAQIKHAQLRSDKALEADILHGRRELELIEARHKAASEWESELLQIMRIQATATQLLSTALELKFKSEFKS